MDKGKRLYPEKLISRPVCNTVHALRIQLQRVQKEYTLHDICNESESLVFVYYDEN